MKKIQESIIKLELNNATYKKKPITINPTLINFFYGNNGSGKSTIAKTISEKRNITYSYSKSIEDYSTHVFNNEYIQDNMNNYHNLPGVFTFNKGNIDSQSLISELENNKITINNERFSLENLKETKEKERDQLTEVFTNEIWKKTEKFRKDFKESLKGNISSKEKFKSLVLNQKISLEHPYEEIKNFYNEVYNGTNEIYENFKSIKNTNTFEKLPGTELLSEKIISSSDSEFSQFIKALNSTSWIKQGLEHFHSNENDKCPFCQQLLPSTFESDIASAFDDEFIEKTNKINELFNLYSQYRNDLISLLNHQPLSSISAKDREIYKDKVAAIEGILISNLEKLSEKKEDYSRVISLKNIESELISINLMITTFNTSIDNHNMIVSERSSKKIECNQKVLELIYQEVYNECKEYRMNFPKLVNEINTLEIQIINKTKELHSIEKKIKVERKNIVNTKETIDNINLLLEKSGFQGFKLQEKQNTPNVYEVIREDGSIAKNLSEGERNFIAFLYFYHEVKGSISSETPKDKIVVIDDPVSSMDSSTLFIVGTLVREMVKICENNIISKDNYVMEKYIKQIFILTHNTHFHKEITYDMINEDSYRYVNFYLITKVDNTSNIKLCTCDSKIKVATKINYNPVKNSYHALWEEFKEIKSPIPLMNVIRRILNTYFLQLCGYSGKDLQQVVLYSTNAPSIFLDSNTLENYQLIRSMLAYLNSSSDTNFIDDISFSETAISTQQIKDAFHMIFISMNQEQHYNHMMEI